MHFTHQILYCLQKFRILRIENVMNIKAIGVVHEVLPIHSLIPPTPPQLFYKYMNILLPEVGSYLEGFMCEVT